MKSSANPQTSSTSSDWLGFLLLVPAPLFWAGNFLAGRMVAGLISPMTLLFWRWVIALLLILPFALKRLRRDRQQYWQHRWRLLLVSLSGIVAFNAFVYTGLHYTTAANALLLNSFIPIMIVLLAALFYRQRLQLPQLLGMLISFSGVMIIICQGQWSHLISMSLSRGDLLVFCAVVTWALYTLWLKGFPAEIDRTGLMAAQMIIGLVVMIPIYLLDLWIGPGTVWNRTTWSAVAYIGVFPSVVAYLLYSFGVARVGAARAGLSIHLIPVFGVVLAVLLLHEKIHLYHATGILAIAVGIVCVLGWERLCSARGRS